MYVALCNPCTVPQQALGDRQQQAFQQQQLFQQQQQAFWQQQQQLQQQGMGMGIVACSPAAATLPVSNICSTETDLVHGSV